MLLTDYHTRETCDLPEAAMFAFVVGDRDAVGDNVKAEVHALLHGTQVRIGLVAADADDFEKSIPGHLKRVPFEPQASGTEYWIDPARVMSWRSSTVSSTPITVVTMPGGLTFYFEVTDDPVAVLERLP